MANKLDRFTQRARRVLAYAQEEAERLNHSYIGTEHLLLGLLREESGIAGKVLRDLNVQYERVTELVERITGPGRRTPFSQIDLTPRTKRVIELAVDEARRLGQHYIGTEHLLLGLIRQGDGVAIDILRQLGVNPDQIRRETMRALQETPSSGEKAAAGGTAQPAQPKKERPKTPMVDQLATRSHGGGRRRQARSGHRASDRNRARDPDPLAPHQEQSRPDRRAGRGQDRHHRRPGAAHRQRRCAGAAARQARAAARRGLAGGGHDVSRPVRRAPQARDRRDQEQQQHSVHRRSAHARRRGRGRIVGGCGQHPQARAGARRIAVHRRDDDERVSQAHRKRCGPGAPLPADLGGRADD